MEQGATSAIKDLSEVFTSRTAKEMSVKASALLQKLAISDGGYSLVDSCINLFCKVPQLYGDGAVKYKYDLVAANTVETSPLIHLIRLVLTSAPHSMVVERAVSHYNLVRRSNRLSMSLASANSRMMIALNGVGTACFDPRPAVAAFLNSKGRRFREADRDSFKERPFAKKFFYGTNL